MKERRERRKSQTSSTPPPVVSLSLFVSNGGASGEKAQITVELSSDELEQPQLTDILASLDSDCACE